MAVIIEHDKRKHDILEKAFELFMEEGYENVTFQKIADKCQITRTTLYIYFNNKREIFLWSIKQLLEVLEGKILLVVKNESIDAKECLEKTLDIILDTCEENRKVFKVLLSYLLQLEKSGENVKEKVERRVVRLKHFVNIILIKGEQEGSLIPSVRKDLYSLLYSTIEHGVFKLAIYGDENLDETRAALKFIVKSISK